MLRTSKNMAAARGEIVIHSKPGCSYCTSAKRLLQDNDIEFVEIVYQPDDKQYGANIEKLIARTSHPTFPQIFIGEDFIGGADDLLRKLPDLVTLNF